MKKNKSKINIQKIFQLFKGGKERSDSSLIALKYIKKFSPSNVLIHDAARPNFYY
jgi:2-C-methyl-D-erythritol 4-phosphate cytidylyltransferase/2-C-methyl-D-erythritol 2,4-cyclodiphosphate synthase